ncbi:peptidylprolyl isomerase [Paracoccaceae bacterium GXU_MW_L88]
MKFFALALMSLPLAMPVMIAAPAAAQAPQNAAILVNGDAITYHMINERARFVEVAGGGADPVSTARDQLIDEALQLQYARRVGAAASTADIADGMQEYAGRRNMSPEELISALEGQGVSASTVRRLVEAGVSWRNVVQAQFRGRATPSERAVDGVMINRQNAVTETIRLREIALPFAEHGEAGTRALAQRLVAQTNAGANFSTLIQQYSRSRSALQGGYLDWMPLGNLPPQLRSQLENAAPGQAATFELPVGILVMQLAERREEKVPMRVSVTYAKGVIPMPQGYEAAMQQAAGMATQFDTCDGFESHGAQQMGTHEVDNLPGDVAMALARLDRNEISYELTEGNNLQMLMLCERVITPRDQVMPEPVEGEDMPPVADATQQAANAVFNQNLNALGEGLLQELRRRAVIEEL